MGAEKARLNTVYNLVYMFEWEKFILNDLRMMVLAHSTLNYLVDMSYCTVQDNWHHVMLLSSASISFFCNEVCLAMSATSYACQQLQKNSKFKTMTCTTIFSRSSSYISHTCLLWCGFLHENPHCWFCVKWWKKISFFPFRQLVKLSTMQLLGPCEFYIPKIPYKILSSVCFYGVCEGGLLLV